MSWTRGSYGTCGAVDPRGGCLCDGDPDHLGDHRFTGGALGDDGVKIHVHYWPRTAPLPEEREARRV